MLTNLTLSNFKKFESFRINFTETNVIVGPNNAGKSSVLDALRVLSDFLKYAARRSPKRESQGKYGVCATYYISNHMLSIPIENVTRNYSDEVAVISAKLDNKSIFRIELSPHHSPKGFLIIDGEPPKTIAAFLKQFPCKITIVPTLSPFEENEILISDKRINEIRHTRLASRNFRNIWYRESEENFSEFETSICSVWSKIRIKPPEMFSSDGKNYLQMFYREGPSEREIYWAGFGFQVWLQTISQIIFSDTNDFLVLDEPDVYLHPDLQKKLIDFASQRFKQIAVATHSTEIINHVDSKSIKMIDSTFSSAKSITSSNTYNKLFAYLGASENAEFAKLSKARKIVFFEGNDRKILRKFLKKSGLSDVLSDPNILLLKTGGFGGWSKVRDSEWVLQSALGIDVKIFALFDRDYICAEEATMICGRDTSPKVAFHVLEKKEIENYCISLPAIKRLVSKLSDRKGLEIPDETIDKIISQISAESKVTTRALLQTEYQRFTVERAKKQKKAIPSAAEMTNDFLEWFDRMWSDIEQRLSHVSGKKFVAELSAYFSQEYGINLSINKILDEMRPSEVDKSLLNTLHSLCEHFAEN